MTSEFITVETVGRVATVTFDRPDALNALTAEMLRQTGNALEGFARSDDIGVVVLTGAGRAFTAGVDLKALQATGRDLTAGDVGEELNAAARRVQRLMEHMPQAVIAKVNGFCFTGGVELMLAADIAIAAEEAKFGDTHAKIGLRPTWGMTQRLARRVGMQRAKELSFTARTITGVEAAQYGLIMEAVPLAELDTHVAKLAAAIAENSAGSIAAYKDLYRKSENAGLDEGLRYEAEAAYEIADVGERMGAILARLKG
ncbi:enoyl-CoA hydratase/isomerase family protein [Minwuia thermotolerans]|uniref:Enoyl-CoA hydratase/isomerase family protein n=1 Tax=Minwuia thermotolerans TaxID=2056226 RepID=A0A2M9FXN8_9PROT|nr:enoyl-CoA hydratase-related protein [Minwuia thermotolerans]PJK28232.1 enoyl-CoA hydratase/isomerase family protein [Minwuia thermotolerans]